MKLVKSFQDKFVMAGQSVDETRKRTFLAFCIVICTPVLFLFALEDLLSGRILEGLVVILVVVVFSGVLFSLKRVMHMTWLYRLSGVLVFLMLCYELVIGAGGGFAFLWFYFFPLAAFYLVGNREGIIWVVGSLLISGFFFMAPLYYTYSFDNSIRFLITYSIVSVLSFGLEYSRNWYYEQLNHEKRMLEEALDEVKTLQSMLPICSICKSIRDDQGYWKKIESYMYEYVGTQFSHSVCPTCVKEYYPDIQLTESKKSD